MQTAAPTRFVSIGAVHSDTVAHAEERIRRETSTPARLSASPGGVATNIARAVNALGIPAHLIGAVGKDAAATTLREQLTREGLNLTFVPRPGHVTGQYLALHDPDGSLAAACVDDRVLSEAPPDVFDHAISELRQVHDTKLHWFVDTNLPEATLARVIAAIGGGVIYANAVSDAKAPRLRPFLADLACVSLNRGEAAALLEMPVHTPPEDLAAALRLAGLKQFILTGGSSDLLACSDGHTERMSPPPSDVVNVTGAGDALSAGFLAALLQGLGFFKSVRFGLAAASLTLESTGAFADGLSWDKLEKFARTDKI
ncbi:PfkB family carbohydrate kinase [Roseibium sp.]|uniref:PfkB family carbohydrate kinase n=1 Tax=Roseibium sp. TaxID=1936156 RepID=UPI003BA9196F